MRNLNWVFGKNAGLNFTGSPISFFAPTINAPEGSASISSTSGNLLFFTDGTRVWNAAGTLKISGLLGHPSSTQSAVIVPDPGNGKRYYVFTTDGSSGTNNHLNGIRLTYTTPTSAWPSVPLSSLMTMPPTVGFSSTERVIAVRHENKKDYWILTIVQRLPFQQNGDIAPGLLRVLRVTATGVSYVGDQPLNRVIGDIGQLKASANGRHIAFADMCTGRVILFPFSSGTGLINLAQGVDIPAIDPHTGTRAYPYGVEFSWSGRLLYFSTLWPLPTNNPPTSDGRIFQHFISTGATQLVGSRPNLPPTDAAVASLQLASDKQIYITQGGDNKLGVVASPDIPGIGCAVTFNAQTLSPTSQSILGLPNMIRDLF
jgi:hypothetical protein